MHHPKADVERLYVLRHEGGRGLIKFEMNFKISAIGLHKYLSKIKDFNQYASTGTLLQCEEKRKLNLKAEQQIQVII